MTAGAFEQHIDTGSVHMKCYSYKELRWMGKGEKERGVNKFLPLKMAEELWYSHWNLLYVCKPIMLNHITL